MLQEHDGKETIVVPRKGESPLGPLEGPGKILGRHVTRVRSFSVGEVIRFSFKDLAEICMFIYLAADSFFMPALEFAKRHGIK